MINLTTSQTVVVEASTNLVDWLPVQTNSMTAGPTYFNDSHSADYPARFYRARSL